MSLATIVRVSCCFRVVHDVVVVALVAIVVVALDGGAIAIVAIVVVVGRLLQYCTITHMLLYV